MRQIRQTLFCISFLLIVTGLNAQIEVLGLVGKKAKDYSIGFGGFLKFSFPVNEVDYGTIEAGGNFFKRLDYPDYGIATIPVKFGYRYTLDRSGTGFYLEPQVGYNVYGVMPVDGEYDIEEVNNHGPVGAVHFGYLFEPWKRLQFDLGGFFETVVHIKGGSTSYVGIRLTHSFTRNRDDYY